MNSSTSHSMLATHVLRTMARAHEGGRRLDLDGLVIQLGVRRADVRGTLSQLHREGLLDVQRMRLTLRGYALGRAFAGHRIGRPQRLRQSAAA